METHLIIYGSGQNQAQNETDIFLRYEFHTYTGDIMSEVAITTVSKRGQIVIPKEIRDELGLTKNVGVAMKTVSGKLVLTRISLSDKDFELKETFVKKMKKREKMKGIPVNNFAKRYGLE